MRKVMFLSALALTVLLALAYAAPAHAQATRTWVSGVGDDANPCSRTAPCKTFAGAISKTAVGGEINVLDPGGFGALTITKAITIRADHVQAGVLVSGTNGFVVQVPNATDKVYIEGLDIEGLGTGLSGILVNTGGHVVINRCKINNFTVNGVTVSPSVANSAVVILNSLIINNGVNGNANTGGVLLKGSAASSVSISDTTVENNANYAVQADAVSGGATIGLVRSVLAGNLSLLNGASGNAFGPSNVVANVSNGTLTQISFK